MTAAGSTRHTQAPAETGPGIGTAPAVCGMPLHFLRWEGLVLFSGSLAVYFGGLDQAWWLVPLLLFLPDIALVGYARSHWTGALAYNLAHSYPAPALVGALAVLGSSTVGQGVALIWFAHIGMDRALGYGLKYATGFHHTHLGRIEPKGHGGDAPPFGEQPSLPAHASVGGTR